MKRLCIIMIAFALTITLTHCKKDQAITDNLDKTVKITLNVNNNSKVAINTDTGSVEFESGDMIYVASNGVFVGTLTHNGTNFTGTITDPTEGQPLYFYFLGNLNIGTLTAGASTACSASIIDQTENLPVISAAASNEDYDPETTSYTAMLLNKCALVKFHVTTPSNAAVCLTGLNNRVTISFSTNTFTYSQINGGIIRLAPGSGEDVEKWAILLPQSELTEGTTGSAYSFDGTYNGIRPSIPVITENTRLANGIDVTINTNCRPTGAVKGLFSASANKQVYFSQGNLQYNPGFRIWQFAYPQYSILHDASMLSANVSSEYTSSYNGWIDLFGWATSGTRHGAICYQPYSTDQTDSKYYAYGNASYNLYDRSGAADWGCNAISNGGEQTYQWRTPTSSEWDYLLNSRTTPSGIRYAKAIVNGVKGLIILPDNWDASIYALNNTNNTSSNYSNAISESDWQTYFEANGAVFLPSNGWRDQTNVIQSQYYYGYYWASDCFYIPNYSLNGPYCLRCSYNSLSVSTHRSRHYGVNVRLIQDKEQ